MLETEHIFGNYYTVLTDELRFFKAVKKPESAKEQKICQEQGKRSRQRPPAAADKVFACATQ